MKKLLQIPYSLLRWLIIILIFLVLLLLLVLEAPSLVLGLATTPLKEQGITYGSMEGGLLSGFRLKDVNYQDKAKIKEVSLKVDFERLRDRVLYIDELTVEGVEIEKEFLASLIDGNSSEESSEENGTLPFDRVVVNRADISLKNIIYDVYRVNDLTLQVRNLTSDMKEQHQGELTLLLDSNFTQLDLNASIKDDFVKLLANIEPSRDFIEPFVAENNISLTSNPLFTLKAEGDMKKVNYHLTTHRLGLKQNAYQVDSDKLILFGHYGVPSQAVDATLQTKLKGSMAYLRLDGNAKLKLDDVNNTLIYTLDTTINPKEDFLSTLLADQNISFFDSPTIKLKSSGGMKKLNYNLVVQQLKLKQNEYEIASDNIGLQGDYSLTDGDVTALLKTEIDSNMATLALDATSSLNTEDINNTLIFDIHANLVPKKAFVESKIADSNITVQSVAPIAIIAKGNLRDTAFNVDFQGLKGKREDIDFEVEKLLLIGKTDPLGGDTEVDISTDFDSTVGRGHIQDRVTLNFNDLNNTLKYNAKIAIDAKANYINPLLKEQKIEVKQEPKINLEVQGEGIEKVTLQLDAKAKVLKANKLSKVSLHSSPIALDLKNHTIEGNLKLHNEAKDMGLNLTSRFQGDYTQPKTMQIDSDIDVGSFNAFGFNLNPIAPLNLKVKNTPEGALVTIDSKRLKLHAKTADYDHFEFDINTQKIYLYKMMELPKELDHKYIQLDLKGSATLSKEFFALKGFIRGNKKFKAKIDAQNGEHGLDAKVETEHLQLTAKGDIKTKNIIAEVKVDSLTQLQQEISRVYEVDKIDIEGPLHVKATLKGEAIWAKVTSAKIAVNGFDIEAIDIDANYDKDLVTLNRFDFTTTGFEDKKLNKKVYLNQKGKIYLGKRRDVLIDMHPNILITSKGDEQNFNAKATIKKLPLGHPDYGSMFLNCDIDYKQQGEKKSILGEIIIKKMKLFYEAKFLDADYDSDVVIITKRDKKKKVKSDDSFLKNTFIDLKIKAPHANYKTRDIDLKFDINLKANKLFGKALAMTGKVEEITGRVDQAPKRFHVKESNIVFTGGKKVNPLLDIVVEYELPQVLITIAIGGNANRPKIDFSSEPPMPKKDIISYLMLGVSTANLGEGQGTLGRAAELFILNQAARDLAYDVELDRLFIKDDGTGVGYAVEAGKKISKKNMFIIESSKEGNSFILEHDVSKNIKLRVGQHQKEIPSQSLDIYFRKRFK